MGINFSKAASSEADPTFADIGQEMEEVYGEDAVSRADDARMFIDAHGFDNLRIGQVPYWEEMMLMADSLHTLRDENDDPIPDADKAAMTKAAKTIAESCACADPDWAKSHYGNTNEAFPAYGESVYMQMLDANSYVLAQHMDFIEGYGKELAEEQGITFDPGVIRDPNIVEAMSVIDSNGYFPEGSDDVEMWEGLVHVCDAVRYLRDVPYNQTDKAIARYTSRGCEMIVDGVSAIDPEYVDPTSAVSRLAKCGNLRYPISTDLADCTTKLEGRVMELDPERGRELVERERPKLLEDCSLAEMPAHRAVQKGDWTRSDGRLFHTKAMDEVNSIREGYANKKSGLEAELYRFGSESDPDMWAANQQEIAHLDEQYKEDIGKVFGEIYAAEMTVWSEKDMHPEDDGKWLDQGDTPIVTDGLRFELGQEYADFVKGQQAYEDVAFGHVSGNMKVMDGYDHRQALEDRLDAQADMLVSYEDDECEAGL